MNELLTAACVQVEPVLFDRAATIERIAELAAEASGNGARLILFPEAFIPPGAGSPKPTPPRSTST